jgi:hypothetical protein
MPKLVYHHETEYDFVLTFRSTPAPKLCEIVQSPITDDNGQCVTFLGTAAVVATECRDGVTTAYCQIINNGFDHRNLY